MRLHHTGAKIVAIAGNHDSAARVAVADQLLEHAGVTIRGDVAGAPGRSGWTPTTADRPWPSTRCRTLNPRSQGRCSAASTTPMAPKRPTLPPVRHREVTSHATTLIRRHAGLSARFARSSWRTLRSRRYHVRLRARSHGPATSTYVDTSVFKGFDYVALGHLHRDQDFDNGRVAYSGTPLPYSFSEERDTKSVRIVEMDTRGHCRTEVVPLGVGRPLRTLRALPTICS